MNGWKIFVIAILDIYTLIPILRGLTTSKDGYGPFDALYDAAPGLAFIWVVAVKL